MRVTVVGLGSIGNRHLANIRAIEPDAEITVLRHARSNESKPENADRVVFQIDEALSTRPDVVFICGPTTQHAHVGIAFAQAGAHIFVEKPLAASSQEARELLAATERAQRHLIVGYNLRFLPSLQKLRESVHSGEIGRPLSLRAEVGQYLPDWRPGTDYRNGNSARAGLGAGIEFELSHEIDYTRWLLGDFVSVSAMFAKTSDLEIEVDDTAEFILKSASGAIASIHLDMTRRDVSRTCRITGTEGTLVWDAHAGEVRRYTVGEEWVTLHQGDGDRNQMYVDEARHVFACARGNTAPLIDGVDGLRIVEIAEAARRSSSESRRIALPSARTSARETT